MSTMTVERAGRKMRVRIEYTVEVDVEGWCETYGTEPGEVRIDVVRWAHGILDGASSEGLVRVVGSPR